MTDEVIGTVTAVRRDGRGIQVDGDWYSSYHALDPVPNKGDKVKFPFKTKGSFKNISGKVVTLADDDGTDKHTKPAAAASKPQAQQHGFPVGPRDYQRSIIRQNALTNARELFTSILQHTNPEEEEINLRYMNSFVDSIIKIARQFEAYTTGDLEMAAARELKKKSSEEEALSAVMSREEEEDNSD